MEDSTRVSNELVYSYYSQTFISTMSGIGVVRAFLYRDPNGILYVLVDIGDYNEGISHSYWYNVETKEKHSEAPIGLTLIQSQNNQLDSIYMVSNTKTPSRTYGHQGVYSSTLYFFRFCSNGTKKHINAILYKGYRYYSQYGILLGWNTTEVSITDITSIYNTVPGKVSFRFGPDWCSIM